MAATYVIKQIQQKAGKVSGTKQLQECVANNLATDPVT